MMTSVSFASVIDTQGDWRCTTRRIFGGARRKLSTQYGLVVTLCEECHRTAPHAVHQSADTMQYLHEIDQRKAMEENGWSVQQFMEVFGKNYLEVE